MNLTNVLSQTGHPNDGADPTGFFNVEFHTQLTPQRMAAPHIERRFENPYQGFARHLPLRYLRLQPAHSGQRRTIRRPRQEYAGYQDIWQRPQAIGKLCRPHCRRITRRARHRRRERVPRHRAAGVANTAVRIAHGVLRHLKNQCTGRHRDGHRRQGGHPFLRRRTDVRHQRPLSERIPRRRNKNRQLIPFMYKKHIPLKELKSDNTLIISGGR